MTSTNDTQKESKPRAPRKPRVKKVVEPEEFGTFEDIFPPHVLDEKNSATSIDEDIAEAHANIEDARQRYEDSLEELAEVNEQKWRNSTSANAPGYWKAFRGSGGNINVFAWLGIGFAFTFFPLGFLFSGLGLMNSKAVPEDKVGRVISWIGLIISVIAIGFVFASLVAFLFSTAMHGAGNGVIMAPGPFGFHNPVY